MKTKVYKLLSILLTLAILATTFLGVIGTVSAEVVDTTVDQEVIPEGDVSDGTVDGEQGEVGDGTVDGEQGEAGDGIEDGGDAVQPVYPENSYFISAKGITIAAGERPEGAGSFENPVKTFGDVTRLIAQDGLTAEDTAYVYVMAGETVGWVAESFTKKKVDDLDLPTPYVCNLILDSTDPEDIGTVYEYDFLDFAGNVTFKNVKFNVEYMYGAVRLGHYDIVFEEGSITEIPELYIGPKALETPIVTKDFNLVIKGQFKTGKFYIGPYFNQAIYNSDINILVDNKNTSIPLQLTGFREDNYFIYNGNININVLSAKALSFAKHKGQAKFNGALQLMVSSDVKLPYSITANFNELEIGGGKWYITNAATEKDFVTFSNEAGKFNIKDDAKSYVRQFGGKLITNKSGAVDLSNKAGAYTISDKPIDEILDNSHKMLYFKTSGSASHIASHAQVTPGKTYRFEYSIYTSKMDETSPAFLYDGDRSELGEVTVISSKEYKNYYKVVAEATVPETYDKPVAFFGVNLPGNATGVIFDRKVYEADTSEEIFYKNAKFHDGLDHVTLNYEFWGAIYTDSRGGAGLIEWTNDVAALEVKDFDAKFIDYLINEANPDDGEWWDPKDYVEEKHQTFADAKGSFKTHLKKGIKGVKFLLASEDKTYTTTTNAKGEFEFAHILTGFYELFILDGKNKIETGFASFIGPNDLVTFAVVSDTTSLLPTEDLDDTDSDETEEIIPTGNFAGTVYTPMLDVVDGLKLFLRGIGDVVTDANGSFAFANIPVGTYDLYTVLEDGTEYLLKEVKIEENRDITSKLKYDPAIESDNTDPADNGWIIWVIVASAVALVVVAGLVVILIVKKKAA